MGFTVHLDHDIEQRLHEQARASGESPDAIINRVLSSVLPSAQVAPRELDITPCSQGSPEIWAQLTPEYQAMIEKYEEGLRANRAKDTFSRVPTSRPRFVVKPFDLGGVLERWKGLTPSEILHEIDTEEYEEKRDRTGHESASVRL